MRQPIERASVAVANSTTACHWCLSRLAVAVAVAIGNPCRETDVGWAARANSTTMLTLTRPINSPEAIWANSSHSRVGLIRIGGSICARQHVHPFRPVGFACLFGRLGRRKLRRVAQLARSPLSSTLLRAATSVGWSHLRRASLINAHSSMRSAVRVARSFWPLVCRPQSYSRAAGFVVRSSGPNYQLVGTPNASHREPWSFRRLWSPLFPFASLFALGHTVATTDKSSSVVDKPKGSLMSDLEPR